MLELLNNAWGLFEAAELRDSEARDRFMDVYYALSTADDAQAIVAKATGASTPRLSVTPSTSPKLAIRIATQRHLRRPARSLALSSS